MIPYGKQEIIQSDIDSVVAVLISDYLTQGPQVPAFENAVAQHVLAKHAVACNSATSALHVACLALGLGPGDRFWTSPITFVASANCGLYCGAKVELVDIDPATYNMSIAALTEKLTNAERDGKLPKVVIPVHFAGQSCDMLAIGALAERYGFRVIEDASHAIGGRYQEEPIGSCHWSDVTVFSFHPVKIITTGEGGLAVTNDPDLAERMDRLRTHGITRDTQAMVGDSEGPWYYQQIELGFNYRMTDIQAALGLSQLERLDAYVARRHELADRYDSLLADLPVTLPYRHPDSYSAFHLYVIKVAENRRAVFERLRAAGIGVNVHYIPVHTQPYYRNLGFASGDFPEAEAYYAGAVSLPMFATMNEAQQDQVVAALKDALEGRSI